MSQRAKYTETQINAYIKLRAQGWTNRAIERETGIKESTQRAWQKSGKYQKEIADKVKESSTELALAEKAYDNTFLGAFSRVNMSRRTGELSTDKTGRYIVPIGDGNGHGTVWVKGIIGQGEQKLLQMLNTVFSKNNISRFVRKNGINPIAIISYSEAAKTLGKPYGTPKEKASFRRYVNDIIAVLQGTEFHWEYRDYNGGFHEIDDFIVSGKYREETRTTDKFGVVFSLTFASYEIGQGTVFQLPNGYYLTESPVATILCRELARHYSNRANRAAKTHNILSVKALLKALADVIPSYQYVKEKGQRHYKQKIIDPFVEGLNELAYTHTISEWHYCNSKHKKLTPEQEANQNKYEVWIDFYIEFELPEQELIPVEKSDSNLTADRVILADDVLSLQELHLESDTEPTATKGIKLKVSSEKSTVTNLEELKQDVEYLMDAPTREEYIRRWAQQQAQVLEPYIEGRVKDVSGEDFEKALLSKVKGWDGRKYARAYFAKAGKVKELINSRLTSIETQLEDETLTDYQRGMWHVFHDETMRAYKNIRNADDNTNILVFEDSNGILYV